MDFDVEAVVRACRRSRIKLRVYDALLTRDVASPAELADAAETTIDRVLGVLHGDARFRADTSLVRLGVVRTRRVLRWRAYSITQEGAEARAEVGRRLKAAGRRGGAPSGETQVALR